MKEKKYIENLLNYRKISLVNDIEDEYDFQWSDFSRENVIENEFKNMSKPLESK
jgi:hypothetical protein